MRKRILSLFLTLMFAVTLVPMTASAAGNPYPTTQNVDGDAYYEVPCTWFAWQSVYDNQGVAMPGWGNAGNWLNGARNSGYATGSTPAVGAVAVWQGNGYGHVAYVVSVQSTTTFTINEGGRTDLDQTNSHGVAYSYKITNAVGDKRPYDNGLTLVGFIYPKGKSSLQCTWETPSATKITQTNAFLYGKLNYNQNANCTQAGVRVINASTGASVASKDEYVNYKYNYVEMWYDLTEELGVTLTPGTTYKYNFYAIVNGKEYWSPVGTFTTEGHTHRYTSTVTRPTCTAKGYTTHTCSCGDWYRDNFTNALGHNYSNGKCTRCGEKDPNYIAAPVIKITTSAGKPKISWSKVEGAVKYKVYRSTDGKKYGLLATTTGTSITNTKAKAKIGTKYYYKVKAVNASGAESAYSNVKSIKYVPATPTVTISRSGGKAKLSWKAVTGATKYYIYRSTDGKNFEYRTYTTKLTYTDSKSASGKKYYYKVKAVAVVNGTNVGSNYSAVKSIMTTLAKPTVKITTSNGKPKLSWNKVTGADKYYIYRSTDGKTFKQYTTTTKTSFTNTGAKKNTKYYYKVKAVCSANSNANSAYSTVVSIKATK